MKKLTNRIPALFVLPTVLLGACSSSTGTKAGSDAGGPPPRTGTGGASGSQGGDSAAAGTRGASGALGGVGGTGNSGTAGAGGATGGASGDSGSLDGGSAGGVAIDPSWTGRAPAMPLFVRDPYFSVWLPADAPNGTWPTFWTGDTKGMSGIARVDGTPYVLLGSPTVQNPGATQLVSRKLTPTNTEFVLKSGAVEFTLSFLSPVEPGDLKRQSAPIAYLRASAASTDGAAHAVSVYFDISGEWAESDVTQQIRWARDTVAHSGGDLTVQSFTPNAPRSLSETRDYPAWGTAFLATAASATTTVAIGPDTTLRGLAATQGKLDGSLDATMPRAANDRWPVLGFAFDLGQVSTSSKPVTLVVGHERSPSVSYEGAGVEPLWRSYFSSWQAMVADAYDDGPAALTRANALDQRIVGDARKVGGDNYAALCTLSLRQTFGGTELVGTPQKPWLMLKEISSDGNVSTVDVAYPASPALLYTNPYLLKLMLDPLLEYAETGGWPKKFAEHDIGSSYPNATGHNDGNEEDMPIEESADMLIMMAGYAQRAKPADAKTYALAHYAIAKRWADYLVPNTLVPQNQNQTDDFTGFINQSANLALKGIVGVGAMSILSNLAGNGNDHDTYLSTAQSLIASWETKAQDGSGKHLLLEYDVQGGWSLKYNALYDRILGLNLVSPAILAEEAAWYTSKEQAFGIDLDPRNAYTKSDWEIWTAGAVEDTALRKFLIDSVYGYATKSAKRVAFGDWYDTASGNWHGFQARPVQGGMFSLLARYAKPIVAQ